MVQNLNNILVLWWTYKNQIEHKAKYTVNVFQPAILDSGVSITMFQER